MKRLLFGSLAVAAVFIFFAFTANVSGEKDSIQGEVNFAPGEKLEYLLYSGFIKGGVATLTLREAEINGRKFTHARADIRTIGMVDKMYNVRERYESYFDPQSCKPVFAIRDIKDGDYKSYSEVTFYHGQNKVVSSKSGEKKVPQNIFDIVSAFYQVRRSRLENLKIGDTLRINTFFEDKVFPLLISYQGKQTIEMKDGKYKTLKFLPMVEEGRVFEEKDDLTIYLSDDANHIPLRLELDLIVGSAKCDLISKTGLLSPTTKIAED